MSNLNTTCIITAGGTGNRFKANTKKQFFNINGKSILEYTIDIFYNMDEINEIILTLPASDFEEMSAFYNNKYSNIKCVLGGLDRQESVFNALCNCNKNTDIVLIHDGVRPFVSKDTITKLIDNTLKFKAVIPASKVKNTIKEINDDKIIRTVERSNLVEVYTPQVFDYNLIFTFHNKAKNVKDINFTDDAGILEYFNIPVHWVECESNNIKITTLDDLDFAKYIISKNKES